MEALRKGKNVKICRTILKQYIDHLKSIILVKCNDEILELSIFIPRKSVMYWPFQKQCTDLRLAVI